MSFLVGAGGVGAEEEDGGGGGATADAVGFGLLVGDSDGGDQGIGGRALVMLFKDIVLLGVSSFATGLLVSTSLSVDTALSAPYSGG